MNAKIREARFKKLIAHLRSVPRRGFNMFSWVRSRSGMDYCSPRAQEALAKAHRNKYECGMTACIGGHAVTVFPRLLTFRKGIVRGLRKTKSGKSVPGSRGSTAISEVLGITEAQADDLTSPYALHQTPKEAALFLEKLLKKYK